MRHIVPMHQLVFVRVAQFFGDFVGMTAQDFLGFGAAVIAQPAGDFLARAVHNGNQFAALKMPVHAHAAHGQQAAAALLQRGFCARIHHDAA